MIVYVTNNKEPWTLNLESNVTSYSEGKFFLSEFVFIDQKVLINVFNLEDKRS